MRLMISLSPQSLVIFDLAHSGSSLSPTPIIFSAACLKARLRPPDVAQMAVGGGWVFFWGGEVGGGESPSCDPPHPVRGGWRRANDDAMEDQEG